MGNSKKLRSSKRRKKTAGAQDVEISPQRPLTTLLTLPADIQELLFKYLDVKSLESLSRTCSLYDQMINGRYITTMTLPFREDFRKSLKEAEVIEKKSILRLECKEDELYRALKPNEVNLKKYVVESQLALLDLRQVREIDLEPGRVPGHTLVSPDQIKCWNKSVMERVILTRLSGLGVLGNISRLKLLFISNEMGELLWKGIIPQMRNLLELHLTVVEKMAV